MSTREAVIGGDRREWSNEIRRSAHDNEGGEIAVREIEAKRDPREERESEAREGTEGVDHRLVFVADTSPPN